VPHQRRAAVNTYVRPRRTFSTVDEDREVLGQADTVSTRRPVHSERLKRLPHPRLAAVLPSILRLTTKFLPRFGSLETTRRPVDRAAAVPIETAYMRARIRTNLHAEMYFDFIASFYHRDAFWRMWCWLLFSVLNLKLPVAFLVAGFSSFYASSLKHPHGSTDRTRFPQNRYFLH